MKYITVSSPSLWWHPLIYIPPIQAAILFIDYPVCWRFCGRLYSICKYDCHLHNRGYPNGTVQQSGEHLLCKGGKEGDPGHYLVGLWMWLLMTAIFWLWPVVFVLWGMMLAMTEHFQTGQRKPVIAPGWLHGQQCKKRQTPTVFDISNLNSVTLPWSAAAKMSEKTFKAAVSVEWRARNFDRSFAWSLLEFWK